MSSSSKHGGRARLALLAALLAGGCQYGTARSVTLAELGTAQSWERVAGVPEIRQVAREDCGAAALAMVLGYWRLPDRARRRSRPPARPDPSEASEAADLRDFARRQGLQAFVIEGRFDDLDREIRRHHPVVVGMMKRYAQRAYPPLGSSSASTARSSASSRSILRADFA